MVSNGYLQSMELKWQFFLAYIVTHVSAKVRKNVTRCHQICVELRFGYEFWCQIASPMPCIAIMWGIGASRSGNIRAGDDSRAKSPFHDQPSAYSGYDWYWFWEDLGLGQMGAFATWGCMDLYVIAFCFLHFPWKQYGWSKTWSLNDPIIYPT